jgi:hypothetical protein
MRPVVVPLEHDVPPAVLGSRLRLHDLEDDDVDHVVVIEVGVVL